MKMNIKQIHKFKNLEFFLKIRENNKRQQFELNIF